MEAMYDFFASFLPLPKKQKVSEPRSIVINDPEWRQTVGITFLSNKIFTAKYNPFTFIPKFLFEQFLRLANFYFLVISIIQMSSVELAPTGQYYTFAPLMGILFLTALKELFEDLRRHRQDAETNAKLVDVLQDNVAAVEPRHWKDVCVGDIVKVHNEQFFPADLFLLSSSEPDAVCYIETSNLDGETNLKIRQGISEISKLQSLKDIQTLKGSFDCEGPNNRLYNFEGALKMADGRHIPIGPNQVLLRGSMLRNTSWIFGLVIYTGHDSKLLMNASSTPIKKSRLEKMVNKQIMAIFCLLFTMAIICTIAFVVWEKTATQYWYLLITEDTSLGNFTQFVVFVILFNTVVPISLYVSIEFVKFTQAMYINLDLDMFDSNNGSRAVARTSNLNEELGQIDFVFSDKTGTLTRNQMQFRKCSIAGIKYGHGYTDSYRAQAQREGQELPPEPNIEIKDPLWNFSDPSLLDNLTSKHRTDSIIREFLTLLAVCHTVIPEKDKNHVNRIVYQASSPDEAALVTAAKHLGFYFNVRKPNSVKILALSSEETYEILNVLEFTSTRKRMSVIVRTPLGKIKLFCKGADSVIMERLASKQLWLKETEDHLQAFAVEGLRTLVLAMRELDEETYAAWNQRFHAASVTLTNRAEEMEKVSELIEVNLFLLGATAIEDKLQEGVPEAVQSLLEANIKVWMLTGDKKETAINIGWCCQLIRDNMTLLVCDEDSEEGVSLWCKKQLNKYENSNTPLVMVVDGKTLTHALEGSAKADILQLAVLCKSCICCRVSPIQKAMMVDLVRKNLQCVTLAIGDGANDVSMIQTADVGVGITGVEGLQAARSADYTISQFRFLKKLLLVHGAWSYRRLSKLILYSFYKTLTLYLVSFYFSFVNGYSGQVPWDKLSNALWNVIFTLLPPIFLGIFDQDVSAEFLMAYPRLYASGQRNDFFNLRVFFGWFFSSIYHSLVIYLLVEHVFYFDTTATYGYDSDIWLNGTVLYACVLMTVTAKFSFTVSYWPWPMHLVVWGSLGCYLIELIITGFEFIRFYEDAQALYTVFPRLFGSALFYFTILLVPLLCMLRDFTFKYLRRYELPEDYHIIQEIERSLGQTIKVDDIDQDRPSSILSQLSTVEMGQLATDTPRPSSYSSANFKKPLLPASPPPADIQEVDPALQRSKSRSGYAYSEIERESWYVVPTDVIHKYDTEIEKPEGN